MSNEQFMAFNIWDCDSIRSVIDAAAACGRGVILQTSSRIFEAMDTKVIRGFVSYYSKEKSVNAFLHLDHCRKLDVIKSAIAAGWDSVMIDASNLPLETNIELTNTVCSYAHKNGVLVEAEVGQIYGVENDVRSDFDGVADMKDVAVFLSAAHMDMFAAAIGTCHGLYQKPPHIHYDMIEQIGRMTDKPFVVHGGSGLTDEEFRHLLSYQNVRKINVSTELKQAYRYGIIHSEELGLMAKIGFEATAIKEEIYKAIRDVAEHKLSLLA